MRTSRSSSSGSTWDEALAAIDGGEVQDGKSLVGLLWLARMGGPAAAP